MRSRIKDRLQELDEVYPPLAPWLVLPDHEKLSQADKAHEGAEWVRVRRAMRHFLEMDGKKRMQKFEAYEIGGRQVERLDKFGQCLEAHGGRALKSTSFIPAEVEYTLPLYLDLEHPIEDNEGTEGNKVIVLDNPTGMKARKALSYIRYLLRSAAIGYHCLSPHESDETIYQLVLPLRPTGAGISSIPPHVKPADPNSNRSSQQNPGSRNDRAESPNSRNSGTGWVASLNPFKRPSAARSVSLPAQRRSAPRSPPLDTGAEKKGKLSWLRIWIKIEFQSTPGYHDGSGSETPGRHYLTPLIGTQALPDLSLGGLGLGFSSARRPSPRRRTTTDRYPSTSRPSPLSRQVSPDRRSPTPSRASTNASSAQLRRARGKIIVHLSDPRGYEVLRSALDIKHSGLSDDGDGDGEASESSPVIIQVSRDAEEDQEEGERGRPRSKESTDSSVLLMSADRDKAKQDGLVGVQVVSDSDGESRSRKPGLWGLLTGTGLGLGSGSDGESTSSRSMSMPPAREAVV